MALCTIGFGGDWVRLSSDTGIWLIVIYIFLGVTLLSTTLHIVHQVIISEISDIFVYSFYRFLYMSLISSTSFFQDACINLQRYHGLRKKKQKTGSKISGDLVAVGNNDKRSKDFYTQANSKRVA